MSPEQIQYLRDRLAPKILVNGLPLNPVPLGIQHWNMLPRYADLVATPWLWIGATIPPRTHARPRNPVALIRSPGLPVFPYTKNQMVPVHRLLHHLIIGPVAPNDQVRYRRGTPVHTRANVNPFQHVHMQGPVYVYEPPSLEEAGGYSELEGLRELLREGKTVDELLMDFTQEEIDAALASEA